MNVMVCNQNFHFYILYKFNIETYLRISKFSIKNSKIIFVGDVGLELALSASKADLLRYYNAIPNINCSKIYIIFMKKAA